MSPPTTVLLAAGPNPVAHAVNHPFYVDEHGWWWWSAHMGNLVLTGIIMLLLIPYLARQTGSPRAGENPEAYLPRNRLAHAFEWLCVWLRDNAMRSVLGDRADRFAPFLWTLFFFILINNLLGLVPILDLIHLVDVLLFGGQWKAAHRAPLGGTATQNLWVTGILAFVSFLVINISGIRRLGLAGYLQHLTAGTRWYLWWMIVPVEIMSTFVRPVALAIRLFANMTAGHIMLAMLFIFVGLVAGRNLLLAGSVTLASVSMALFVYVLELLVAVIQAFVFMLLTAVFIAQLDHHDHDAGHAPDRAHHAPAGHGPPQAPVPAGSTLAATS